MPFAEIQWNEIFTMCGPPTADVLRNECARIIEEAGAYGDLQQE
jgi:hypothetical protein